MNLPADRSSDFPSTIMSMIENLSDDSSVDRRPSMERLISFYRRPMVGYLCRKTGISPDQAEDFVQQFLLQRLIEPVSERNLVAKFADSGGRRDRRFRDYLRTSLKNFFLDELRRKRQSVDGWSFEPDLDVADDAQLISDPEFEMDLAQSVLNETIRTVRNECRESDQWPVWQVFCHRFLVPVLTGSEAPDYETLCRCGLFQSPHQARNLLQTALRKFDVTLRAVVAATLPENVGRVPARVEEEIEDLLLILKAPGAVQLSESLIAETRPPRSDSGVMVNLLQLHQMPLSQWNLADYPGLWGQVLKSPLVQLFGSEFGGGSSASSTTVESLIQSDRPELETLRSLKNQAKRATAGSFVTAAGIGAVLPSCFFGLLYTLSLAVAQLRLQTIITRSGTAELCKLAQEYRSSSWLDPHSRAILEEWVALLSAST